MPHDYNGTNPPLYHTDVKQAFKNSAAKTKICIADACFSGSFKTPQNQQKQLPKPPTTDQIAKNYYKNFAPQESGVVVLMSSRSGQTSAETVRLQNGVFTHYLLQALQGAADTDRNRTVTITELYVFVRQNVMAATQSKQIPIVYGRFEKNMPILNLH